MFGNSGGGFSDFFNAFFGGFEGQPGSNGFNGFNQRPPSTKGKDYKATMEISINEAYNGTSRIINVDGQKLRVTIKPGAYDGQELRIKGKGQVSYNGGSQGDLYIKIKILPDSHYEIQGNDLLYKANIDVFTAITGGKTEVNTIAGKLSLKIPKGSQPGCKLRLRGKGMPSYNNSSLHGDLFIKLNVNIPKDLSQEELDLVKKLKNMHKQHSS